MNKTENCLYDSSVKLLKDGLLGREIPRVGFIQTNRLINYSQMVAKLKKLFPDRQIKSVMDVSCFQNTEEWKMYIREVAEGFCFIT